MVVISCQQSEVSAYFMRAKLTNVGIFMESFRSLYQFYRDRVVILVFFLLECNPVFVNVPVNL